MDNKENEQGLRPVDLEELKKISDNIKQLKKDQIKADASRTQGGPLLKQQHERAGREIKSLEDSYNRRLNEGRIAVGLKPLGPAVEVTIPTVSGWLDANGAPDVVKQAWQEFALHRNVRVPQRKGEGPLVDTHNPFEGINYKDKGKFYKTVSVLTLGALPLLEHAITFAGKLVSLTINAVGAVGNLALKAVGKGLDVIGNACDYGFDKAVGKGKGLAALASPLKLVGAAFHASAKAADAVGTMTQEAASVVGGVARVFAGDGSGIRSVSSGLVKVVANAGIAATDAAKELGKQIKDLGNKLDIPVVSHILRGIGSVVQAVTMLAEGAIRGLRAFFTGDFKGGVQTAGTSMKEGLLDVMGKEMREQTMGRSPEVEKGKTKDQLEHDTKMKNALLGAPEGLKETIEAFGKEYNSQQKRETKPPEWASHVQGDKVAKLDHKKGDPGLGNPYNKLETTQRFFSNKNDKGQSR